MRRLRPSSRRGVIAGRLKAAAGDHQGAGLSAVVQADSLHRLQSMCRGILYMAFKRRLIASSVAESLIPAGERRSERDRCTRAISCWGVAGAAAISARVVSSAARTLHECSPKLGQRHRGANGDYVGLRSVPGEHHAMGHAAARREIEGRWGLEWLNSPTSPRSQGHRAIAAGLRGAAAWRISRWAGER